MMITVNIYQIVTKCQVLLNALHVKAHLILKQFLKVSSISSHFRYEETEAFINQVA